VSTNIYYLNYIEYYTVSVCFSSLSKSELVITLAARGTPTNGHDKALGSERHFNSCRMPGWGMDLRCNDQFELLKGKWKERPNHAVASNIFFIPIFRLLHSQGKVSTPLDAE
jgi:hypothetical protein